MDTPILFLIFNRPDLTEQVFSVIRQVQPKRLFVSADGPRIEKPGDVELCEATREIVVKNIDWKCEVTTLFRERNLGCKVAVSKAITWFFENVEEGIILEDDCLPDKSFFWFCEELLKKYRTNAKVMHISGDCFLSFPLDEDYYFTNYTHIWGWATWRRAWKLYDVEMKGWKEKRETTFLKKILKHKSSESYWRKTFDEVYLNQFDTWDHQWTCCCWINNGLSIAPSVNLVSNIGFRYDATHTRYLQSNLANVRGYSLKTDRLVHPKIIAVNKKADGFVRDTIYAVRPVSFIKRFYFKLFKK